jgi:uncharacterized protein (TIGR02145 family)
MIVALFALCSAQVFCRYGIEKNEPAEQAVERGEAAPEGKVCEAYDEDSADYAEAARVNPDFAEEYFSRGNAYCDEKEYDMAIADYTEAIRLNPDYARAYNGRGFAYMGKFDCDMAVADFETALRIKPDYEDARKNLEEAKMLKESRTAAPDTSVIPLPEEDTAARVTDKSGAGSVPPPKSGVRPRPPSDTEFTDSRDGKTYGKVTIGRQVWMAQNLNYDIPKITTDVCYENKADNCAKYGRLYELEPAKQACPAGFHLPSDAEWKTLVDYAGGPRTAAKKLKSRTGWKYHSDAAVGTDDYGFSALPGGSGYSGSSFETAGYGSYWWSGTKAVSRGFGAWGWGMGYGSNGTGRNEYLSGSLLYVRCLQD